jgi:hypothetical protein
VVPVGVFLAKALEFCVVLVMEIMSSFLNTEVNSLPAEYAQPTARPAIHKWAVVQSIAAGALPMQ